MAKTLRKKYDLYTLCIKIIPDGNGGYKNAIIGADIVFDDDTRETVKDWSIDYPTNELHLDFESGESGSFSLMRKYQVYLDSSYKNVKQNKKKNRRAKRGSK
ncbi:MAG: hypothetical protein ACTSPC_13210 [Candidatus Heimdallarchaeota archaeon]